MAAYFKFVKFCQSYSILNIYQISSKNLTSVKVFNLFLTGVVLRNKMYSSELIKNTVLRI